MYEVNVVPKEYSQTVSFVQLSVNYDFNQPNSRFVCTLIDKDRKHIDTVSVYLTPEEYSQWTDSDEYVINLVLQKLGLTQLLPTTPTVES